MVMRKGDGRNSDSEGDGRESRLCVEKTNVSFGEINLILVLVYYTPVTAFHSNNF